MIHEILLALSGHASPLFQQDAQDEDLPYLSPSEKALLSSLGQLAELHRRLREHIEQIATGFPWTIGRAVATSIKQTHLSRFQETIVSVENKILTKDVETVGAYDIVPLASIVGHFDEWHRLMSWYWDVATFIEPVKAGSAGPGRHSGAALIDKLRSEQQTGFPSIAATALELSKVAETAWLQQLTPWLLKGRLPTFGADDFFIKAKQENHAHTFSKERNLLPKFVTAPAASSILFVGKSLVQIQEYGRMSGLENPTSRLRVTDSDLLQAHLQHLTRLPLPITAIRLNEAISAIRASLSQNVLQDLLPLETTMKLFQCLKQFFLLERGGFALALISEADARMQSREQSMGRLLQQDPVKAMKGLSVKDSEFQQTLVSTFKALASKDDDAEDEVLDFAERHMTLSGAAGLDTRPSTSDSFDGSSASWTQIAFNDLLMPSAASLNLTVTSPLDLVIAKTDLATYSSMNAYLLALRRAQVRLSDMWRRTIARRDNAAVRSTFTASRSPAVDRIARRRVATRKVWATCSAAIFLLSEISGYFEGEIIRESWECFELWIRQSEDPSSIAESTVFSTARADHRTQRDPETLAAGHRAFLAALSYALLLNDHAYTKDLRSLLGNVDHLVAFFNLLVDTQAKLDLEQDAGEESGYTIGEERRIALELDRARKRVDSDLKAVVQRLRNLDEERIGAGRSLNTASHDTDFKPWQGGGVDRLLMKLEFGRTTVDDDVNAII